MPALKNATKPCLDAVSHIRDVRLLQNNECSGPFATCSQEPEQQDYRSICAEVNLRDNPYAKLAQWTENRLAQPSSGDSSITEIALPDKYARHRAVNGKFTLSSKAWQLTDNSSPLCEIRMVLIKGSTNEIINTWVFPLNPKATPVFAAELISIGNAPRLTFMDIQTPGFAERRIASLRSGTSPLRQKYHCLQIDEEPPAWAIDATAGDYIFGRKADSSAYSKIQACYCDLFNYYFDYVTKPDSNGIESLDLDQARWILHEYQHHHMQNSPGKIFLGKVFGEDWTTDFLLNFLFNLPGELA